MSSHRAWRGAIEFAGFPVNVALYGRVKKSRNESFRTLAPSGQLKESKSIDPATGKEFPKELERKGLKVGPHEYVPMTEEAIEQINAGVKTEMAQPSQFVPLASLDLTIAIERFVVRPDTEVAGSAQGANILWNGLKSTGLAYTAQMSIRGGHDAILVVYATETELLAVLLPFAEELYDVPVHEFTEDAKAQALFAQALENIYEDEIAQSFDHAAFKSEYRARREAAIQAVLDGQPVTVQAPAKPVTEEPDLMKVLAMAAKKPSKKAPTKTTKRAKAA